MKKCSACSTPKPEDAFRPGRNQCKRCEADAQLARKTGTTTNNVVVQAAPSRFPIADAVLARIYEDDASEIIVGDVKEPEIIVGEPEKLTAVEEHRLKTKNAELQRQVKSLTEALSNAQAFNDVRREAAEAASQVKPITIRERTSGFREGTAQVLFSDVHIEEEVRPEQVAGRNRYNLEISKARCERFFQATRDGINMYRGTYKIRDLILWLGGDIITGYLHPDNIESNLLSPVEAIAEAYSRIRAGINHLLLDPELERVLVPCSDGNHGRISEKMRSAARVQNSIEWLLYKMLADSYVNEPRVEFILPEGAHNYVSVYGDTIHYHHGDEAKYGGGVGGIMIPLRKVIDRWNTVRPARLHCVGHFHQRLNVEDLIVNGSVIGYGPYSFTVGARFEPPTQDFSILDSKRWRGPSMPIWVADREDDQGI